MIVLDTNVVSETLKPQPDAAVLAWLDSQLAETLHISSVTVAELLFGVAVLAAGKRRNRLTAAVEGLIGLYEGRVLPFDLEAASTYAALAAKARTRARGFPIPDGYIAAIAASRNFIVASRDSSAFEACGLRAINPWSAPSS
ncbi:MAG: type II toxin-antitoxin system VapC family toxin [Aquabacterium sp.]|nr:type II toxin-antitoxin system VapC family toxin [Aquabacterium sp.]